jgi:hypothetical protein
VPKLLVVDDIPETTEFEFPVTWEDNVRMDLQEVRCGCEDWTGLARVRDRWRALVSAVRNLRIP